MSTTTALPKQDRYLRNRPFLCIEFVNRPAKGVKTEKAGWKDITGSEAQFEKPYVVDRVNDIQMRNANIIVDVLNGVCVKNGFPDTPSDQVAHHFLERYREQVKEAMDIWLTKAAQKVVAQNTADGVYSAV